MALLDDDAWHSRIWTGSWTKGHGETFVSVEPATGLELGNVGAASVDDVRAATARAAVAQRHWAALPYHERGAVLRRAGDLLAANAQELAGWLAREAGAVMPFGMIQAGACAHECYEAAALASDPYGEVLRTGMPRLSFSRRTPVGVVGVIAPFNVPTVLAIRAIAPALALGNAVVLKPDPRTSISGGVMFAKLFEQAGVPEGVFQVLPGAAEVGQTLVTAPEVRVIAFTGSTQAGRAVGTAAAQHLKRTHLELGGNSPLIVLPDVDVEAAAATGAWGAFVNSGQICMATSRHLVHESIVEQYTALLAEKADALKIGDPFREQVTIGPLIDAGQRDRVHALVTASVAAGAEIRAGGTYEGLLYRPTVLANVSTDTPAFKDEIFGPVAPVTAFSSLDEAVELASNTAYGLALGILTSDMEAGLELADRIPAGLVHVNDQTINEEAVAPFGGVGDSGTGSRHGSRQANLEAFTETQWFTLRSKIPSYPF
ncbi:aldehyde dehydrogenase family protein [Amycolatopsis japonica]